MKKNILLILMFISMFFIGSNDVSALQCKNGDTKCTTSSLQEKLGNNKQLTCAYKIEYETLNSGNNTTTTTYYYNYIYYDLDKGEFFANSTHELGRDVVNINAGKKLHELNPDMSGGWAEDLINFNNDQMMLISEEAHNLLKIGNQCPQKSYISENAYQVCFDNNNECKNNGKELDYTTNFNTTRKKEGELDKSVELNGFKYKKLLSVYKDIEKSDIPSGYNDICTYKAANGNYIHLMYNDTTNRIVYKKTSEKKLSAMLIDNNKSVSFDDAGMSYYENYSNKIGQVKSCPSVLYEVYSHVIDDSERKSTVIYQTKPEIAEGNKKDTTITEYKLYDASDKTGTTLEPIDECSDLIDPNSGLGKIIKTILKVIGIAVPILLIGLVTFDLATAVLAGDDKAVNTAKSNAIKRVIIAVIIFFVPTLMNFVFGLINEVWDRNFSTCMEELNK